MIWYLFSFTITDWSELLLISDIGGSNRCVTAKDRNLVLRFIPNSSEKVVEEIHLKTFGNEFSILPMPSTCNKVSFMDMKVCLFTDAK